VSILGTRVLRSEDPRFLTGGDTYIDNLDIPGAARTRGSRRSTPPTRSSCRA
jgi:hypothetical protein